MDAITYLKEKKRLTKNCTICKSCKLSSKFNGYGCGCYLLEEEYPEEAIEIIEKWAKEIDWSKVEVDAKLLVSNNNFIWEKRHFAKYENGKVYVYQQGCSSYTTQQIENFIYAEFWNEEYK